MLLNGLSRFQMCQLNNRVLAADIDLTPTISVPTQSSTALPRFLLPVVNPNGEVAAIYISALAGLLP